MNNLDFKKISDVLENAADIKIKTRAKTFFDVSGFPHYENVISNILAFFFDTSEEHGFKDLWLKSLFDCYNSVANRQIQLGEFEEIEREHPTEDNKRIDIVISLDNAIVVIENKIYATPYNPFDSYHKEISKKRKDGKPIVEILLSLKKEGDQTTSYNTIFYNVTYESLIEQVKRNSGSYICNANEKWLLFMKEVINNIENLGDIDNMNKEWQEFLRENRDNISKFIKNYSEDIEAKNHFINNLEQEVKKLLPDSNLDIGVHNTQNSKSFGRYSSMYINLVKGEDTIVIEPYIMRDDPLNLVIELWNRKNRKYSWSKELNLLQNDYPNAGIKDDGSWGKCLRLEILNFDKGIISKSVAEKIESIYSTLTRE